MFQLGLGYRVVLDFQKCHRFRASGSGSGSMQVNSLRLDINSSSFCCHRSIHACTHSVHIPSSWVVMTGAIRFQDQSKL